MSRFSPTVRPSSRPGGLGGLAAALQEGVGAYRDTQDRAEAQRTRQFGQDVQRGALLQQGVTIDSPEVPETFGSALSRAFAGQPATPAVPKAPAPGAFSVDTGDFQKVDPRTGQPALPVMRSGNTTYDPNVPLQREGASLMQKGRIGNQMESEAQDQLAAKLRPGLERMGAEPEAGLLPGAASSWFGKPQSALQFTAPNAGNPGGVFNKATGQWEPIPETNPVPRAVGLGMANGGMGVAAREKLVQIDELLALIPRAQAAQVGPDGKLVESGRVAGVIPLPNWVRLQFGIGGRPSRQLQLLVSDLTSRVGNLRSGGAITPQEYERLEGFLPTMNEAPEVIADKLQSFYETLLETRRIRAGESAPAQSQTQAPPAADLVGEFESRFPTRKP